MAMHTIDRVREAEQKADAAREEAELNAERIVDSATQKAQSMIAQARADAEARDKAVTGLAKSKADELVAQRADKASAEAAALREKTMNLKQNIINKLIEETLV